MTSISTDRGPYLLDTNVISETRKKAPSKKVTTFLEARNGHEMWLSVLTIGELRRGIASRRHTYPDHAANLAAWVDRIELEFADRIADVDLAAAGVWAELTAMRSRPIVDSLIAATAIARGMTLVTRNVADMHDTGVTLLNPWDN